MKCVECFFPALFFAVYSDDGPFFRSMNEPVREPVCAICAANKAADDLARIERIEDSE